MLSAKLNQTKHNIFKEIKPNDASCYLSNQTKLFIMLSAKSNQTVPNVFKEFKPNATSCYH